MIKNDNTESAKDKQPNKRTANPQVVNNYLKTQNLNFRQQPVDWEDLLFPHKKQQKKMHRDYAAMVARGNQRRRSRRRSKLAVGLGVIALVGVLALANSGLPEGETIGGGVMLFAFVFGFIVMVGARKAGL